MPVFIADGESLSRKIAPVVAVTVFFSFSLGKIRETDDILRVRGHADGRCLFRCLRHESVVCHKKTVLSLFVVVLRRPNAASWPIDYSHDGGALLKFVWIYPSCLPLFF